MKTYKNHKYANIFPAIEDLELQVIIEDIQKNGLQSPIVLFEGKILDGRNRYKACQLAGVDPEFVEFKGNPLEFVISANLHRRHLSESQRAAVAAELLTCRNSDTDPILQREAAKIMNISRDSVNAAKKLKDKAPKKVFQAVKDGKISINKASLDLAKIDKEHEPVFDKTEAKRLVPDEIVKDWNRANETAAELVSKIQHICTTLKRGLEDNDVIFREFSQSIVSQAEGLRYSIKSQLPAYAVCFSCHGRKSKNCDVCSQRGFVSKYLWDSPGASKVKALIVKSK
jgi:predicted DNA-binding protein (UPF0251 family)